MSATIFQLRQNPISKIWEQVPVSPEGGVMGNIASNTSIVVECEVEGCPVSALKEVSGGSDGAGCTKRRDGVSKRDRNR